MLKIQLHMKVKVAEDQSNYVEVTFVNLQTNVILRMENLNDR